LDDAIIVDLVLRRQDHAFQASPHASELPGPITAASATGSVSRPGLSLATCSPTKRQRNSS
jgi:hypothetical protein